MTQAEQQELLALRAENAKLKTQATAKLKFSRSDKSETIILSGLRRFPVSFYEKEWAVIFSMKDAYESWLKSNLLSDDQREHLKAIATERNAAKMVDVLVGTAPKTQFNPLPLRRTATG